MTCAEFQRVLPYIIESGGNAEQEDHLRSCQICSDLVADLKYIAEQAKLLVPMVDPNPRVWAGIRSSLQREGLVRKTRARGRLLSPKSWGAVPWMATAVAAVLLVAAVIIYPRGGPGTAEVPRADVPTQGPLAPNAAAMIDDDQALLSAISTHRPSLRSTYEESLKRVDASISDARQVLDKDPRDEDAQHDLMNAYEQKSMMYDMAFRSLQ